MQLTLKPFNKNIYPLNGFVIRGNSMQAWFTILYRLKLNLNQLDIYPLPGTIANSIWGCFVHARVHNKELILSELEHCQQVSSKLFIAENTTLSPALSSDKFDKIFKSNLHFYHPVIGLVELADKLDVAKYLVLPVENEQQVKKPMEGVFIPFNIRSFEIASNPEEDVLQELEKGVLDKRKSIDDKPVNLIEKAKLKAYKLLFRKEKDAKPDELGKFEKTPFLEKLEALSTKLKMKNQDWSNEMQADLEDIEKRNQREVDKLLRMIKENPEEGLKYAIPLSEHGTGRGGFETDFKLSKLWANLLNFSGGAIGKAGNGGGIVNLGNDYYRLHDQYRESAQQLMDEHKFEQAAFIYLKLLKDYSAAATCLESGGLYKEAATIYLNFLNSKKQAAICYEKGMQISDAIKLYKEMNMYEKAGDLHLRLNQTEKAKACYNWLVIYNLKSNKYLEAAKISSLKLHDTERSNGILLDGWRLNQQSSQCLLKYLRSIDDDKACIKEISRLRRNEVKENQQIAFLHVLADMYSDKLNQDAEIRNMAYELVEERAKSNPGIVMELKKFNKHDQILQRDALRFVRLSR